MSSRVSPTDRIRTEIELSFDGCRELCDVIEHVARLGARLIIQTTAGRITVERPKLRGTAEAFELSLFGTGVTKSDALDP